MGIKKHISKILAAALILGAIPIGAITVHAAPASKVSSIKLNKTRTTTWVGSNVATDLALEATVKGSYSTVKWRSSNPAVCDLSFPVAEIEYATLVPKKAGTVIITAEAGGKKAKCSVKVNKPELIINKKKIDTTYEGKTKKYALVIKDPAGRDITSQIVESSSYTTSGGNVAKINPNMVGGVSRPSVDIIGIGSQIFTFIFGNTRANLTITSKAAVPRITAASSVTVKRDSTKDIVVTVGRVGVGAGITDSQAHQDLFTYSKSMEYENGEHVCTYHIKTNGKIGQGYLTVSVDNYGKTAKKKIKIKVTV